MKKNITEKNPKQHILDVAAHLFARKGFHAVGVREIASKAKVNISMISYYFGCKAGILQAINEIYFGKLTSILENLNMDEKNHEIFFGEFLERLIDFFAEKRDYCRVAILELPIEHPEIMQYKVKMIKLNRTFMKRYLKEKYVILDKYQQIIIGPAFMAMSFSNFLLGEVNKKVNKVEYDKVFYTHYIKTIKTLVFKGVSGLVKEQICCNKKNKNGKINI